jgi:hypothetical protein
MLKQRKVVINIIGITALAWSFVAHAQQMDIQIPEALAKSVTRLAPRGAIISNADVDSLACQPITSNPGLLRADFNGDGRDDFAALIKLQETGRVKEWEGRSLREARFSFVLFLDDGVGGYRTRVVRKYLDFIPSSVVIDIQTAGVIKHRETKRDILIPHTAVTLSFCEKSATAYYFVGKKIHSVPVAD